MTNTDCYKRIIIEGVVQGVGFRPFVYKAAQTRGISGSVANSGGFVEILAGGTLMNIGLFIDDLENLAPVKSKIERVTVTDTEAFPLEGFSIIESSNQLQTFNRFVSPDLPVCGECEREIFDPESRRYGHFFNSCVNCGPRFSIIERIPYDRCNTSMSGFPLCPDCEHEYASPEERRFHSETICCNDCGPVLSYTGANGISTGAEAFTAAVRDLKNGCIIAVKGIGGYHLACSPFDEKAVNALRSIKKREYKPFAVMFGRIDQIKEFCEVSLEEESLLMSDIKPVVVLNLRVDIFPEPVLRNNGRCGCFLPYTPLHSLLLDRTDALIMTSANISGSPIVTDDDEMPAFFSEHPKFAGILGNDRKIVRGVEDSVAHVNVCKPQIIRAARSITPKQFPLQTTHDNDFLAVGGDLKSSFCYVKKGYAYASQYFGDLENAAVFERFKREIDGYASLFDINPAFIVCDAHPGYFSAAFAESFGLPVFKVQHHAAHAASVLAEQGVYSDVIAVCFDGSGFGDDGCIWGGEFLIGGKNAFKRVGHLQYVSLLGADSAAKDAKKTALCYLIHSGIDRLIRFDKRADTVKAAVDSGVNTFQTSSAGRLFDAVSAILGICGENGYEGQCAAGVQRTAELAKKNKVSPLELHFDIKFENEMFILDPADILTAIYGCSESEVQAAALGFHLALAYAVDRVCVEISGKTGISDVVLSGGVFQNSLLAELTVQRLRENGLRTFMNRLYPPNDGGIALGQAYIGGILCV